MVLVEARDVVAGYGDKAVVKLPALTIARGEHTLLLGPSGSGKTTLMNVLAALSPLISGSVKIDGHELATMGVAARDNFRGTHIGLVMQRLHLISALSVWDNLVIAQKLAGTDTTAAQLEVLLTTLGMSEKKHARPATLSQGEAQRVAIARALVNRPVLVIADEPTSALDDAHCAAAMALLFAQAKQYNATLLVATHDARITAGFTQIVSLA